MSKEVGGEIRHFKVQSTTDGRTWDAIETAHIQTGGDTHQNQIVSRFETTDGQILVKVPGSNGEYTIPALHYLIVEEITSNES